MVDTGIDIRKMLKRSSSERGLYALMVCERVSGCSDKDSYKDC